jgi:hypothetical protein
MLTLGQREVVLLPLDAVYGSSEILQMNPKPASMFVFSRPSCKTDARYRPLQAPRVIRTLGRGSDPLKALASGNGQELMVRNKGLNYGSKNEGPAMPVGMWA